MSSFFPTVRAGALAAFAVAALIALAPAAQAQDAAAATAATASGTLQAGTPAKPAKNEKVVQSKDTRRQFKKDKKIETLAGVDVKLPDKALFDKAQIAISKGHFDVARLDLQTMLNTYPDSQYQMRAKLAIADSWYKEGGTAALTQAESEYADFRVFFPNSPEAAEAQMRIGDIYFRQMDKPDRDYSKAQHAEEEYRRMLTDYPDSTLVPQAKQRLREVQEVLATREAEIASYYGTRDNWAAVIARYQTVVDTYPLYSHMDDVLVGLGDAYAAQAKFVRNNMRLAEGPKAKLEALFDGEAADAYRKVILEHSAAPHVEDARDRLEAMGLPVPKPTLEEAQASQALENSRNSYRLTDRMGLMILHRPDTVTVAHTGDPTLTDPKPTLAPDVNKNIMTAYTRAVLGVPVPEVGAKAPATTGDTDTTAASAAPAAPAKPLQFEDVPAATDAGTPANATFVSTPGSSSGSTSSGAGVGMEILTPGVKVSGASTPLPPVEKPAEAPSTVNEVTSAQPAAQAPNANGKNPKPAFDKADESSSKHKKKKGLKKLNPL